MIVFVVGPPSTFFTRCALLIRSTLGSANLTAEERACNSLEDLAAATNELQTGRAMVLHVTAPNEGLRKRLATTRPPTIFVLDFWENIFAYHRVTTGGQYLDCARAISLYYAVTQEIVTRGGGILLEPRLGLSIEAAGMITAAYLGIKTKAPLDKTPFASILTDVGVGLTGQLSQLSYSNLIPDGIPSPANEDDVASVAVLCGSFEEFNKRKPITKFVVKAPLFSANTGSVITPASRWITATGPARIMIFGPYIYLPAGKWTVRGVVGVKELHGGNDLLIEVFNSLDPAKTGPVFNATIPLPANGSFQFEFDFPIADPAAPLDVRLVLLRGAIEGKFDLEQLEFFRRASSRERKPVKAA